MVAIKVTHPSPTMVAIDRAMEDRQEVRWQRRLSGSIIGNPCERSLWFLFRWAFAPETHTGRMLRLFKSGHLREPRVMEELRGAGIEVSDADPETGEQWTYTDLGGHFVVKIDGKVLGLKEEPGTEYILGIKTMNDNNFKQLERHGIMTSKPEHMAQAQTEMSASGIHRFFYYAVNKNTDEVYAGPDICITFSPDQAGALMSKAMRVIHASRAPEPVSLDDNSNACRFCKAKDACRSRSFAPRSCRTCLHSTPVMGGEALWICEKDGVDKPLSIEDQEAGCKSHLYIPDMVPGIQVDVSRDGAMVEYQLNDGSKWVDGTGEDWTV